MTWTMPSRVQGGLKNIINKLVPRLCFLCGSDGDGFLCCECAQDLPNIEHCCKQCGVPLLHSAVCPECLHQPPSFALAVSAFSYSHEIPYLIRQFKRRHNLGCAAFLCAELEQRIRQHYLIKLPDIVTFTPLHWSTLITRGFNQAEFIAQRLTRSLPIPCLPLVKKTERTASQKRLKRKQRLVNLQSSFTITKALCHSHIALVDDVMTTGATAEVISKQLLAGGAKRVDVWTLARTPK